MNLNYTSICHYCGKIYRSNKSTSKYCSTQHNSLYYINGSQIDYNILNGHGEYVKYHDILSKLYRMWPNGELIGEIVAEFLYDGPRPKADELLFVSGFIIKKSNSNEVLPDISIKPMELLSKEERIASKIVCPDATYFVNN